MTQEERAALVERLRRNVDECDTYEICHVLVSDAADQIEADGQRIAELEATNMALEEERNRLVRFVNSVCEDIGVEYDGIVKQ